MLTKEDIKDINLRIIDIVIVVAIRAVFAFIIGIIAVLIMLPMNSHHIFSTPEDIISFFLEMSQSSQFTFSCLRTICTIISLIIIPVVWIKFGRQCKLSDIGLKTQNWMPNFSIGLLAGSVFFVCWLLLVTLLKMVLVPISTSDLTINSQSFMLLLLGLIDTMIIAPIGESILFIGLIFTAFARKVGLQFSIVITAALFMIAHIGKIMRFDSFEIMLIAFFLNMVVQLWLYCERKSLLTPIGFHMAYNFIVFTTTFFWGQ
ncbi:hypothetical protein ES705_10526 [subsurface metagenome]